jgi:DNA-binding response OmpR family regulator
VQTEAAATRRDTVLVVDDSAETLSFLTDSLDQAGFVVLIATDGEAALALVEQLTPDVVLMDARMPGISGFETCRRLKRDLHLPHLPVIFMTGLTETEHVIEGLASGGVDYVTKPVVLDELLARIRVHLGNARIALETRAALDASGRFLVATDRAGRVLWCTPKAQTLLRSLLPATGTELALPPAIIESLLRRRAPAQAAARCQLTRAERRIEFTLMSTLGPDEVLLRLNEITNVVDECGRLQHILVLTGREAEVLLWISRGKSNRDIGEILAISPRTVNKHLEQVFAKLGVENRAAAAAHAVRALAR